MTGSTCESRWYYHLLNRDLVRRWDSISEIRPHLTGMRTMPMNGRRWYANLLNRDPVRCWDSISQIRSYLTGVRAIRMRGCRWYYSLLYRDPVRCWGYIIKISSVSHRCEDCFDERKSLILPPTKVRSSEMLGLHHRDLISISPVWGLFRQTEVADTVTYQGPIQWDTRMIS